MLRYNKQYTFGHGLRVLAGMLLCLLITGNLAQAQTIDEDTPQDTTYIGVGFAGDNYVAQSFLANITQCDSIGVWLQQVAPDGEVRLLLTPDNGGNRPDLGTVLYSSNLIMPSALGSWHYESGFVSILEPGQKYWLVVDGFTNPGSSGNSAIGVSNSFTDTNEGMFFSTNGGQQWVNLPNQPMAVLVAGDTCRFSVPILPVQPALCPDETVTLSAPAGFLTYSWNSGPTTSAITVSQTGFYTVSVVRSDFCVGTGARTVVPGNVPIVNLDTGYTICRGDTLGLSVIPFYNGYLWSTGEVINTIFVADPGLYWVEVVSAAGCITRDSTNLYVNDLPDITLGTDTNICDGGFVFYDAGPDYASYAWSNGQQGRSIFVGSTDSIWVNLVDTNNCIGSSDTVVVEVNPNPAPPVITQDIQGLNSTFAQNYQWFRDGVALPDGLAQLYPDPSPGIYHVTVTNAFGCSATSDSITISAELVGNFVSEGFSPNGDGLNEVFFVEGVFRYPDAELIVYNRNGDEVYRKAGYQNDWDGTNKNMQPLPDGNYFYVLDLGNGNAPQKGIVLINR